MNLKKIFSLVMVGVVTVMGTASAEISNKVLGNENFRQVKSYFNDFYTAVMMHGENAWICMTHWLLAHGYLEWDEDDRNQAYAENKAAVQSRHMKLICEQSGVAIDLKQAIRSALVNEKMYRGSG